MSSYRVQQAITVTAGSRAEAEAIVAQWADRLHERVNRLHRLIELEDSPQLIVDKEGWLIVRAACAMLGKPMPEAD